MSVNQSLGQGKSCFSNRLTTTRRNKRVSFPGAVDNSVDNLRGFYSYLSKLENTGKFKNYRIPIVRDENNNIVYKYKLEQGVSNQFIALELLEKKGFDIEIVKEAKEICRNLSVNNFKNRSYNEDVKKASEQLLGLGIKNVIITLGDKGAYFANSQESFHVDVLFGSCM